ncbi:DUF222 domain-containing protein [Actinomycetospora lutea]|uniref:HNH endonuclease signature motif containing protein n=1 Tax=Actinomycetospora lutea TaxID=663604 RepID=UPI002367132B|nr:HNH endonuclease signature motif containing protein [Actinomycetospora lutea]MDD7942612.1 DUF222 domain-containing protein [Actinomycetospora lutea]
MSERGGRGGVAADLDALDAVEPGPALVAALEELAPDTLCGEDLAAYVRACARVNNRGTARVLEGMHHLGRARAGRTERHAGLDEYSGDEVAVALGWSRTMAARKLDLAEDLAVRLPAVGEAMWAGWLDEPKATRFCEWTRDLCDDHARHVAQVLVPEAPGLPVAELIRRIEATAAALDPDWAARREARAVKNARVILTANPSGSATFAVCDVAAPRGLAMRDRCDAVAAAIRALGVRHPIGEVRAEVAARLLDGSLAGLDDHQVTLLLAAEYHAAGHPPPDRPDDGPDGPDGRGDGPGGPDDGPDGPEDGGRSVQPDPDPDGRGETGPAAGGEDATEGEPSGQGVLDLPDLPDPVGPGDPGDPGDPPVPGLPPLVPGPDPGPGRLRHGTNELRLRLSTALGLDELPATVPGYGTVLAHHARTLLTRSHPGEWRIVLTSNDGHLRHVLLARRRPHPPPPPHRTAGPRGDHPSPRGPARHTIVELQAPTTLLAALDPRSQPAWTALLHELQTRLADLAHPHHPEHPEPPGAPREGPADHRRRRPTAETDRWVRVRDRHCLIPVCRRSAHRAELDHTLDWAHHGPSTHTNLGVLDTHHHRAKHHADWRITQPLPGHFTIRTRAGQRLTTTPPKILEDLPEPRPAHRPRPLPDDGWRTTAGHDDPHDAHWRHQFLTRTGLSTPPSTARKPATAPAVHDPDDPPPF